ncbi:hypothetical protein SFC88_02335 [Nocardioides sp. HM23]|uniref:hypothetical protein n=1 Tax=Nocardioides bizhenqiangii TaxID=3095076 RepID=UPI002ACA1040|nr:hypothetical protein [Nocardioides sp. HM23]MDZ5619643.1 hypothetical protein [Nocardioides sp. HM23]
MKRIGLPLAALLTALSLTLTACGGVSEDDLAEELADNGGVSEAQADCIAEKVFDSDLNDDQIDALGSDAENLEDTDLSAEEQAELLEVFTTATTECITE